MRTNYKGLETIVKRLVECDVDAVIKTIRGRVFRTEAMGDFRVVLVDGRECESEQGIHMRFNSKQELVSGLADALHSVERDNFYTIWVHQAPKPNPAMRESRLKCLQKWIEANRKHTTSNYNLEKLFFNVDAVAASLTEEQLALVNAVVAGCYTRGYDESRQYWAPKYHNLRKALEVRGVADAGEIVDNGETSQAATLMNRGSHG